MLCAAVVCLAVLAIRAQEPAGLPQRLANPPAAPPQPLPYSHRQHLELALLDCADCHTQPDAGPAMTFPGTDVCMSCHASQPATTPALKALASFAASEEPIPWRRVYQLPAYVYWSHASHVEAGLTCRNCHGAVDTFDVMQQVTNVASKNGCVTCHEARQSFVDCGDCHEPRQ